MRWPKIVDEMDIAGNACSSEALRAPTLYLITNVTGCYHTRANHTAAMLYRPPLTTSPCFLLLLALTSDDQIFPPGISDNGLFHGQIPINITVFGAMSACSDCRELVHTVLRNDLSSLHCLERDLFTVYNYLLGTSGTTVMVFSNEGVQLE
ncbi:hypothetical protein J6590_026312 [Homalodisca vitripennis]|nr:hypothetical protein J6590_026312 [Homalodisca vitripennis]